MLANILGRLACLKSTSYGVVIGAVVVYAFSSMGCQLPSNWMAWLLGLVSALPGLISKE